jgi:tRNA threonylcarbamoyladenosine modification (KEOPS) complex  Pcc1 subunit
MNCPFKLTARLFFDTQKKAKTVFNAVRIETGQKFEKRSKTSMNINKKVVCIKIIAKDSKALKASMNSYLKLFLLSENTTEVFKSGK